MEAKYRPRTHANLRRVRPGFKKERKKFRVDSNDFGFMCAGVSNADSYERNI